MIVPLLVDGSGKGGCGGFLLRLQEFLSVFRIQYVYNGLGALVSKIQVNNLLKSFTLLGLKYKREVELQKLTVSALNISS